MSLFLMLGAADPHATVDNVLRLTHADRYAALDGYVIFARTGITLTPYRRWNAAWPGHRPSSQCWKPWA